MNCSESPAGATSLARLFGAAAQVARNQAMATLHLFACQAPFRGI